MSVVEGYVSVEGGNVWYRTCGERGERLPLLALHGGPGFTHDYLDSLEALAGERPVVFYDQLGSGRSDRPDDDTLWTVERFVRELCQVREALDLGPLHLLGQSWGTMLAAETMLTTPADGVVSLTLASPVLSVPLQVETANRLLETLPEDVRAVIARAEENGDFDSEEYEAASLQFNRTFVCRADPWPESLMRSFGGFNPVIYRIMQGPSEFTITGNFGHWDRTDRIGEIAVPTLLTCGRYDECTPENTQYYADLIPGAEVAVFESSAHMAHFEEADRYNDVLRDFLERAETAWRARS
ncbi:MAG: proline iminopeptidase-family hydrolase [Actinobacteria bacterium]|nr:proline iminopeptidase-family hydrolase [Actinomycetota bacterium]